MVLKKQEELNNSLRDRIKIETIDVVFKTRIYGHSKWKNNVFNFLQTLQKDSIYRYYPTTGGLTRAGKSIELGFSCYAMKIYYMTSNLENLSSEDKNNWVNFINSFQATDSQFPNNSYIDKNLVDSIKSFELSESLKYQVRAQNRHFKLKTRSTFEVNVRSHGQNTTT